MLDPLADHDLVDVLDQHGVVEEHLREGVRDVEAVAKLLHHEWDGRAQLEGERRRAEHHLLQEAVAAGWPQLGGGEAVLGGGGRPDPGNPNHGTSQHIAQLVQKQGANMYHFSSFGNKKKILSDSGA